MSVSACYMSELYHIGANNFFLSWERMNNGCLCWFLHYWSLETTFHQRQWEHFSRSAEKFRKLLTNLNLLERCGFFFFFSLFVFFLLHFWPDLHSERPCWGRSMLVKKGGRALLVFIPILFRLLFLERIHMTNYLSRCVNPPHVLREKNRVGRIYSYACCLGVWTKGL